MPGPQPFGGRALNLVQLAPIKIGPNYFGAEAPQREQLLILILIMKVAPAIEHQGQARMHD